MNKQVFPENTDIETIGKWKIGTYTASENGKELLGLKIYKGKKAKPYIWYVYQNEKQRKPTYEYYKKQAEQEFELDNRRKTENHNYKVGDIIYNSWGYEQTNIDFYQVVKTTKKTITIQRIAQKTNETGFMSGNTEPIRDKFISDEKLVKRPYLIGSDQWYINFSHGVGCKLNENEILSCSWYA